MSYRFLVTTCIDIAVAMRWKLIGLMWLRIHQGTIAAPALHVQLILLMPGPPNAFEFSLIIPVATADLYAMLCVLSVVVKFIASIDGY